MTASHPTDDGPVAVSTGNLPGDAAVRAVVEEAYERYREVDDGAVADYIPALACADPNAFGACVVNVDGRAFSVGDATQEFSIQSVSKPFVFALVCDALGTDEVRRRIGVNSTGQPFNSVMALEMSADRTTNPMVNTGAIATTSLVPGDSAEEMWQFVVDGLSRFAGRTLSIDPAVYESEAATNRRNQGLAHLLDGYERMYSDPDVATDVYTMQCSLRVSAVDLAVMGATLADGGVNPISGERVVDESVCRGCWRCSPPRGSTSARVTGCTTSACPARAASAVAWSRSRPARAGSACSPRRSTRPATACVAVSSPGSCRDASD